MPTNDAPPSRLFHAIVLMGCGMASLSGCVDSQLPPWLQHQQCTVPDLDAGIVGDDACVPGPDGGWPPTK